MASASTTEYVPRTGRAKSCTACRQVKLACDARARPGPCTRCVQKDLPCRFDAHFKRLAKRKMVRDIVLSSSEERPKAADVDDSIMSSHDSIGPRSQASAVSSNIGHLATPEPVVAIQTIITNEATNLAQPWLRIDDESEIHATTLKDTVVESDTILYLFKHFELYYYPFIPILQPLRDINHLQKTSPLLFWTVVITAMRGNANQLELLEQLCEPFGQVILPKIVQTSIQCVEDIHALLILCLWPITQYRMAHDPGWSYCGIAINSAQYLGLDQPVPACWGFGDFRTGDFDTKTRVLTWLGCVVNGIRMSNYMGMLPPLSDTCQLRKIRKLVQDYESLIPTSFCAAAEMACVAASYASTLNNITSRATCLSMTAIYDSQLDDIMHKYRLSWSQPLETELLAYKLHLYGLNFACENDPEASGEADISLSPKPYELSPDVTLLLHRCSAAAHTLITSALDSKQDVMSATPDPTTFPNGISSFYTKYWFMSLFSAVAFIFKFECLINTSEADQAQALAGLSKVHSITSKFSDDREYVRGAISIETMASLISSGGHKSEDYKRPAVTDHLGASVLYDALFKSASYHNERTATDSKEVSKTHKLQEVPGQAPTSHAMTPHDRTSRSSQPRQTMPEASAPRPGFFKGHPLAWPIVGGGNPGRPLIHGILGGEWSWDGEDAPVSDQRSAT